MLINSLEIDGVTLGIWKIEENIEQLYGILGNETYRSDSNLSSVKNKEKLKEKLAVRALLKEMMKRDVAIAYTDTGKPLLQNSNLHVSISHTSGYAALALSEKDMTGIDIEQISDKVARVKDKFVNKAEYIHSESETTHLLLHWTAKESIYKALNQKGFDLKNNLTVKKFIPQQKGMMHAQANMPGKKIDFEMHYMVEKEYVLCLAYAKN